MILLYDNETNNTQNLLIRSGTLSCHIDKKHSAYRFIKNLFLNLQNTHTLYSHNNRFAITHEKESTLDYFKITKEPWKPSILSNRFICAMLWEKYEKHSFQQSAAEQIFHIPFIKEFLTNLYGKKITKNDLFDTIEMLSENIKEELATPPTTLLQGIEDGYTFQCSHIAIFTAVCFAALNIRSHIVGGYPKNPISMCAGKPFYYFYETTHPGFEGITHCWLEVELNGEIIIIDPTPYFCSYQQKLYGTLEAPHDEFMKMIKRVSDQSDFEQSPLFEILFETPLPKNN